MPYVNYCKSLENMKALSSNKKEMAVLRFVVFKIQPQKWRQALRRRGKRLQTVQHRGKLLD